MKQLWLSLVMTCLSLTMSGQGYYFPPVEGDWEAVSPESLGWCTGEIDTLLRFLEDNNSKAFLVLKDGKIAMEHYFGSFVADSIWYWASAGKTMTAFLTGLAQEKGFLQITDISSSYLGAGWTACAEEKEQLITVRHQLTMTTGLDDGVTDPYCTLDTCLVYLSDAGTRWAYHNAPYTLLESVVEEATGQNYNVFMNQNVTANTGITGIFLPSGYNNVLYSKPRSMARFGLLILNRGVWASDTIMADTGYFNNMTTPSQDLNRSYGYLWWLNGQDSFMLPGSQLLFPGPLFPDAPADMIAALGKNGQIINVVPSLGIVVIRMGNTPEGANEITPVFNNDIWQLLNNILCNSSTAEPPSQINQDITVGPNPMKDHLDILVTGYVGEYRVTVMNTSGQVVFSGVNTRQIPAASLEKGLYIICVSMNETGRTFKVVKN